MTAKQKLFFPIASLVIVCDWLSKAWALQLYGGYRVLIPGALRVHLVQHRGTALDWFLPGPFMGQFLLHLLTILGCCVIGYWARRSQNIGRLGLTGLALLWGGLFANGVERMWRGHVTDFIETPFTPIFNIADIFIVFAIPMIWIALFLQPTKPAPEKS